MAKEGSRQLGPSKQIKQEQSENDASGSAYDEAETTAVEVSTPPTRGRLMQEDKMESIARRGGLLNTLSSMIFRRGSALSPTKITQALEEVADPEPATEDQTLSEPQPELRVRFLPTEPPPRARSNVAYPTLPREEEAEELALPLKAPGNLATRGGSARSKDPYTLDSSPERGEKRKAGEDNVPSKPAKRQRAGGKAKQPITPPKRTRGKMNRSKPRVTKKFPDMVEVDHEEEEEVEGGLQSPELGTFPTLEPNMTEEEPNTRLEEPAPQIPPDLSAKDKMLVQIEGGDSGLYMDPSPEKIKATELSGSEVKNRISNRARGKQLARDDRHLNLSPNDEEEIEEGTEARDMEEEMAELSRESGRSRSSLINVSELAEILIISRRVGKSGRHKAWTVVRKEKEIRTDEARRLNRRLDRLYKYSNSLAAVKEERNRDKIRRLGAEISSTINRIKPEVENIIIDRLSPPAEQHSDNTIWNPKTMLRDIYFHIIPHFTKCILRYAEIHTFQDSMETSALREFTELVDMFYNLLYHTTRQPESRQPRPRLGEGFYQTIQPGKLVLSKITKLHKALQEEVKKRNRAEQAAERERMRPQLQRAQEEEERLEERVKIQKLKERRQLQIAAFQKQLDDPLLGPFIRDQILKNSEQIAPGQVPPQLARYVERSRSPNSQPSTDITNKEKEEEEEDPFASDSEVQIRINGSFGKNNNRGNNRSQELTAAQKMAFIDTLRYNQGADRYEVAAQRTQLSLDEVFYYARELQEVADRRHERGDWNLEVDAWTYDIWAEQH